MSLFIKRGEIDKNGEINPDSDLGKKVNEFMSCFKSFVDDFLSEKFNAGTASGKHQVTCRAEFKKRLDAATEEINDAREEYGESIEDLKKGKKALKKCLEDAKNQELEDEIVEKILDMLSPNYVRKIKDWLRANERIEQENRKRKEQYIADCEEWLQEIRLVWVQQENYNWEAYDHWRKYLLNEEKNEPTEPLPKFTKPRPTLRQDELNPLPIARVAIPKISVKRLKTLLGIIGQRRGQPISDLGSPLRPYCDGCVSEFLESAWSFLNDRLKKYEIVTDSQKTKDWFMKKVGDEPWYLWFLFRSCTFDDSGIPTMNPKPVDDIYWSVLFYDLRDQWTRYMSHFKEDKSGHSATKKWIHAVRRSMPRERGADDHYGRGRTIRNIVKNHIYFLIDAFKANVVSLSQRAVIKQKVFNDYRKKLVERLEKARKNVPVFRDNFETIALC